jgi:hypothetical protein
MDSKAGVLEVLKGREAARASAAESQYREILLRDIAGKGTAEDAQALTAALAVLGKSVGDATRDREALRAAAELEAILADESVLEQARAEHAELQAAADSSQAVFEEARAKAVDAYHRLSAASSRRGYAERRLRELQQTNPRLFAVDAEPAETQRGPTESGYESLAADVAKRANEPAKGGYVAGIRKQAGLNEVEALTSVNDPSPVTIRPVEKSAEQRHAEQSIPGVRE